MPRKIKPFVEARLPENRFMWLPAEAIIGGLAITPLVRLNVDTKVWDVVPPCFSIMHVGTGLALILSLNNGLPLTRKIAMGVLPKVAELIDWSTNDEALLLARLKENPLKIVDLLNLWASMK